MLYLKSELTDDRWRIYSDNIAMARWLQSTVQGMLNAETADQTIPVIDAEFSKEGDPALLLDRARLGARRGDRADLVQHRRAAADPYPAERRAGPAVRRVHGADPGTRCTPDAERRAGGRPGLAARARRPAVQHLRAGVLRKLDRFAEVRGCEPRSTLRGYHDKALASLA